MKSLGDIIRNKCSNRRIEILKFQNKNYIATMEKTFQRLTNQVFAKAITAFQDEHAKLPKTIQVNPDDLQKFLNGSNDPMMPAKFVIVPVADWDDTFNFHIYGTKVEPNEQIERKTIKIY